MQVTLVDHTENPEEKIANAAAICYGAATTPECNAARIERLLLLGHLSPLRFAYATFHVTGISRVESHQHVRVAHAGILQQSQRYQEVISPVIRPPMFHRMSRETASVVDAAEALSKQAYQLLLQDGVHKEDARYILPEGIGTELVMTGNFQMWVDWLKNRTSPHAQWEIRAVALEIKRLLYGIAPTIFADYKSFTHD